MLRGRRLGLGVVLRGAECLLLGGLVDLRLFESTLGRCPSDHGFIKRLVSLISLLLSRSNIGRILGKFLLCILQSLLLYESLCLGVINLLLTLSGLFLRCLKLGALLVDDLLCGRHVTLGGFDLVFGFGNFSVCLGEILLC